MSSLSSPQEIGKRLRIARELMNIPLEKMAQGLDTSTAKIIQVEQGKTPIPDNWLPLLATDFQIDVHWLITGDRPVSSKTAKALDELEKIMEVPSIRKFILSNFKILKRIFKDEIKKRIIPKRNK